MKFRKMFVGLVLGGVMAVGGVALPAMAANHDGRVDSDECAFFYLQNLGGSFWDTNSATANFWTFDWYQITAPHTFITPGRGQGRQGKEQAESIWVRKNQTARTCLGRNYGGKFDDAWGRNWRNFSPTIRNDNGSFRWNSSGELPVFGACACRIGCRR